MLVLLFFFFPKEKPSIVLLSPFAKALVPLSYLECDLWQNSNISLPSEVKRMKIGTPKVDAKEHSRVLVKGDRILLLKNFKYLWDEGEMEWYSYCYYKVQVQFSSKATDLQANQYTSLTVHFSFWKRRNINKEVFNGWNQGSPCGL